MADTTVQNPPYEWSITWGPVEQRQKLSDILSWYDHQKAMNVGGGSAKWQELRDEFLTDVLDAILPDSARG